MIYTIYVGLVEFKSHILIYLGCKFITLYIVLCQGDNTNIPILDIDDQSTTYMFASKGTLDAYLNWYQK